MAWTIQKCLLVLRPLRLQISKYRDYEGEYDKIIYLNKRKPRDMKVKYGRKKLNGVKPKATDDERSDFDRIIESCRDNLSEEIYKNYKQVIQAFNQFMLQIHTHEDSNKLTSKSAFEVGRCVVYTQGDYEEIEWHQALDMFGDRYRRWVALGTGVGTIINHSYEYRHIIPLLISDCTSAQAKNIGKVLLRSLIDCLPEPELWDRLNIILKLIELTDDSIIYLLERIKETNHIMAYKGETFSILKKYTSGCSLFDLENFILCILKRHQHFKKTDQDFYFVVKLLEIYFDRCDVPSGKTVRKVLKRIPTKNDEDFIGLRRTLQLYINYREGAKWLSINEKDTRNEQLVHSILALVKNPQLFMGLVEYILPCYPEFASSISSRYVSKGKVGLSVILWQDSLENKVMRDSAGDENYSQAFGIWTNNDSNSASTDDFTDDPSDPETDNSIEVSFEGSISIEGGDDEDDELSIITAPNSMSFGNNTRKKRRLSCNNITERHNPRKAKKRLSDSMLRVAREENDDISLIAA